MNWAAGLGLPRHAFVKCQSEPKPVYIDFYNPMALDALSKLAKKNEPMRFSEMRPGPGELWLKDARGRYCSEFRTSFVRPHESETLSVPRQATSKKMTEGYA